MMMTYAYSKEQVHLGEKLLPKIVDLTLDYYGSPGSLRIPYLGKLASGGLMRDGLDDSDDALESVFKVEASGFRDTLTSVDFTKIGIPEEVALDGLMWVVISSDAKYNRNPLINPQLDSTKKTDHCFTYWDGSNWQTRRMKSEALKKGDDEEWVEMWEESELTSSEVRAIQTVATQTQAVHQIADLFGGESRIFENMMFEVNEDPDTRIILDHGFTMPPMTPRFSEPVPQERMFAVTRFYGTAYQQLYRFVSIAHKLQQGNSSKLDSGGIMTAGFHRPSVPTDPVILENGESIIFQDAHPPVPADWLK